MLEKLEMYDIQDKTRLLDEMNETREGVNKALAAANELPKSLFDKIKNLNRILKKFEERLVKLEEGVSDNRDEINALKKALILLPPVGPKPTGHQVAKETKVKTSK